MTISTNLEQAYQFCQDLAKSHYENFPVASILLPKRLRLPISVIYAFARTADDYADEGELTSQQRIELLDNYSQLLVQIKSGYYRGDNPIFIALNDVIRHYSLPIQLLEDLLSAFRQDVSKSRYQNFDEVIDYCSRSANPVGRLLLYLDENTADQQIKQSDAICTALQLINFYQDISQDINESDRIYIPTDELARYKIREQQLTDANSDSTLLSPLLRLQHLRARQSMIDGYQLGTSLEGRIGWEIRAMTLAGITTLDELMSLNDSTLLKRPRLSKLQLLSVMFNSACKISYEKKAKQLLRID